ncbi:hypothetical protein Hypma_003528 [Hypsizygus marmoreus]|uniref:Uncharacterized protein n=1 Tax=Hypsizygus marmoreus TaxID=39966 RepID=A0A369J1R4_HYPMA|nr:hypothetical protein Hypma_003528 [Hypsizygus marmoreus]
MTTIAFYADYAFAYSGVHTYGLAARIWFTSSGISLLSIGVNVVTSVIPFCLRPGLPMISCCKISQVPRYRWQQIVHLVL